LQMAAAVCIWKASEGPAELTLDWVTANGRSVQAKASRESVAFLRDAWGMELEDVRQTLTHRLDPSPAAPDGVLSITDPIPINEARTRFASCCICRVGTLLRIDLLWCDVAAGASGPESAPIIARDRMLIEVQRQARAVGASDALISAFLRWDAALHQ